MPHGNHVDPSGLAEEPSPAEKALRGIAAVKCPDVCVPDVTDWFFDDLRDVYKRTKVESDQFKESPYGRSVAWALYWFRTVKYDLSYKWIAFTAASCGTGKCKNTVMLAGVCIRKNQLGNIAFGFFAQAFPIGKGPLLDPIDEAYSLGGIYDPKHPKSKNFGAFAGVKRADNLAAFGVGYVIAGPVNLGEPLLLKGDAGGQFAAMLGTYLNTPEVLNQYAKYYGEKVSFTANTLTFTPERGGFNTRSCRPCVSPDGASIVYAGVTSQKAFAAIEARYNAVTGKKPSLDQWLQTNYEDYTK